MPTFAPESERLFSLEKHLTNQDRKSQLGDLCSDMQAHLERGGAVFEHYAEGSYAIWTIESYTPVRGGIISRPMKHTARLRHDDPHKLAWFLGRRSDRFGLALSYRMIAQAG